LDSSLSEATSNGMRLLSKVITRMVIIGIDCATKETKTGLALGTLERNHIVINDVTLGSSCKSSVDTILNWLSSKKIALLAFDAPLGWPESLGSELSSHYAGEPLNNKPNNLFSRLTDRVVHKEIKKKPLDVGADRIARTAHAALTLLKNLRDETNLPIPLLWHMSQIDEICGIEVYPAGTLVSRGLSTPKKDKSGGRHRIDLINRLGIEVDKTKMNIIEQKPDVFDAVICVLAGVDFVQSKCISIPNEDAEIAKKEGWIWVKKRIK